ncbi:hypothetical protein C8Q79DRAFT_1002535 [Trametes meyenii]|nr:hypothetical protein C8Q79DRAFT_1002535 [Trametes meyenii]
MCITSPNMTFIPEFPVERGLIRTYADGRWGVREYSRWPQILTPGAWHFACIPSRDEGLASGMPEVLWRTISVRDWQVDPWTGTVGLGFLKNTLVADLERAAEGAIQAYASLRNIPPRRLLYGSQLIVVIRQTADRMKLLPSSAGIAVAVAAHVQRLSLELHGLCTYFRHFLPRLESTEDFRYRILPVIGAFVNEGNAASTLFRLGIPVFFLQPLTRLVEVWHLVSATRAFPHLSEEPSTVPIFQRPQELPGMMNLTGNWTTMMMAAMSQEICSLALPHLPAPEPTQDPSGSSSALASAESPRASKRGRTDAAPLVSDKVLEMPTRPRPAGESSIIAEPKKTHRGGKKNKAKQVSRMVQHPSREHVESPFVALPLSWARSLRETGIVRQPPARLLYFYPPPFLLDTISSRDEKVHRYLHNLVRLRPLCRLRLFEPTVDGRPLTLADWRTVLWGDYEVKSQPKLKQGASASEERQVKRRYEEKNYISSVFESFGSYDQELVVSIGDKQVTAAAAASELWVRMMLLWEAHEINFRCELMTLDRILLPRDEWPILQRWEREAKVSSVWGKTSGMIGILPSIPDDTKGFWWRTSADPEWRESVPAVRALTTLMARWPGCPNVIRNLPHTDEEWPLEIFDIAQREAARFYVDAFVAKFHRLPVVPFRFPLHLRAAM